MSQLKVAAFEDDTLLVRQTFAQFPSGVSVLAVEKQGEKHALVASSFMVGVSLEPCLVAVAVQKSSETWDLMKDAASIGVSIFAKNQGWLTRKLASKDRASRFDGVSAEVGNNGAVFIDDAALWLETSVYDVSESGDHWMILLEVVKLGSGENDPLIWHGAKFRELAAMESIAS
ncbi:flavin reductase family protein [Arthrobacter sp. NPDC056727]|uniref:flavin reductase family protein n=1 Tax=Arthrobacter sp. NPDC056727 TaxID=3345927 RepID=UPI00366FF859